MFDGELEDRDGGKEGSKSVVRYAIAIDGLCKHTLQRPGSVSRGSYAQEPLRQRVRSPSDITPSGIVPALSDPCRIMQLSESAAEIPLPTIHGDPTLSVLVEALTLVVQRLSLEMSYPGGTDAFLNAALSLDTPPRFICSADPQLVNLSFYDPKHVEPAVALLRDHGMIEVEDRKAIDFAYIDQRTGPTMPCDWIEWKQHRDGYTYAWVAGTKPGDMAAPEDWTPERSRDMVRSDIRDEDGRLYRLASEEGVDTYLDLTTGEQIQSLAGDYAPAAEDSPAPMAEAIRAAFASVGWTRFHEDGDVVTLELLGAAAVYSCRYFMAQPQQTLVCCTRSPLLVPKRERRKVMEFITRANYGFLFGAFELSLDEGQLFFRTACDVEGGSLSGPMVCNLASAGAAMFDKYLPFMNQVVYGKVSVVDAIAAAEAA